MIPKVHQLFAKTEDTFLLAGIAAFAGGSVSVAAKFALTIFHPFTLISIRFLFATLFLFPFIMKSEKVTWKKLAKFAPMGIVGALNPILLFIALQYTQASVSPLIYAIVPAMTALYSFFFLKLKLTRKQWIGILVGFFGVALVVLLPLLQKGISLSALIGNALILFAAAAFMIYGLLSKQHQTKSGSSPILLTFYFSFVALLFSLPFTAAELIINGIPLGIQPPQILSAIYIGIIGTGVFYLVYQQALKLSSELAAALFLYLQPIITGLLAVAFLGERITFPLIIGGLLAISGARLAAAKKKGIVVAEPE